MRASCRCKECASPGCVHPRRRPGTSSRTGQFCADLRSWQNRSEGCPVGCHSVCTLSEPPSQGRSGATGPEERHACCVECQHKRTGCYRHAAHTVGQHPRTEGNLREETTTANHSRLAYIPGLVCICCGRTRVREASMSEGIHVSARPMAQSITHISYGPMMILASGTGSCSTCWPSVRGPMHVTGVFTSSSQPSS